jgi:hypothetical protein
MLKMKKAQVDVALTIGSIIVPLAALFGALIFAWAMIGPIGDAGKLAAVIAHDVSVLSDVAYSVPDNIKIMYRPPTLCGFDYGATGKKSIISCLSGYMNITTSMLKVGVEKTKIDGETTDFPFYLQSTLIAEIPEEDAAQLQNPPFSVSYRSFANIKDKGLTMSGGILLEVDDAVIIQKQHFGLYDTLYVTTTSLAKGDTDFLYKIVATALDSCSSLSNVTTQTQIAPRFYSLTQSGNTLCVNRTLIDPLKPDNPRTVGQATVYCFDTLKLFYWDRCDFDFTDRSMHFSNDDSPNGYRFIINATINCYNGIDENNKYVCNTTGIEPPYAKVTVKLEAQEE